MEAIVRDASTTENDLLETAYTALSRTIFLSSLWCKASFAESKVTKYQDQQICNRTE